MTGCITTTITILQIGTVASLPLFLLRIFFLVMAHLWISLLHTRVCNTLFQFHYLFFLFLILLVVMEGILIPSFYFLYQFIENRFLKMRFVVYVINYVTCLQNKRQVKLSDFTFGLFWRSFLYKQIPRFTEIFIFFNVHFFPCFCLFYFLAKEEMVLSYLIQELFSRVQ